MKLAVTGAGGFVGRHLVRQSAASGLMVSAITRSAQDIRDERNIRVIRVPGGVEEAAGWKEALADTDAVIHLAGRVHIMRDVAADPLAEFRRINVLGTLNVARAALAAGVRRFIFVSTIKVNGESTGQDRPFRSDDEPVPVDPYAVSKLEAERELLALAATGGMEVVIVRPVLVYGPGVGGNFRTMLDWLHRGLPLPFRSIENRRSLVGLHNLCAFLETCARHPMAAGGVYLVSDDRDVSTPQLLRLAASGMGKAARLWPVPPTALRLVAAAAGRSMQASRLLDSLQVDPSIGYRQLGWTPPVTLEEELERTVSAFVQGTG